jgi:glycolate oxidase FAD binding subunit
MATGKPEAAAAGTIPAAIASACANVTAADDADAVGGRQARYVAAPATTGEAAGLLRAAADLGLTVVARGSGSRQHWGAPPASCDLIVDTRRLDQILEHAAGDLVVSVQAGVRLGDLTNVLATASQRLALDPPVTVSHRGADLRGGTIGGLIATGAAGPLRFRYGSPRDLLIGITIVRADGTVAKSGGKVVKNVAGYDLGKLFAGSCGTLGLITEATFRLHPKPETSTWIAVECASPQTAAEVVQAVADCPLVPAAIELDWPSAAARISVSVLLEGDTASVGGRAERMLGLLASRGTVGLPSDHTKRSDGSSAHPTPPSGDSTRVRVAFWTGQLETVLRVIREAGSEAGVNPAVSGSAGAGVLDLDLSGQALPGAVAGFVELVRAGLAGETAVAGGPPSAATAVVVGAPADVRDAVDVWGPVPSLQLMRAVKDQFDPGHRMAPGRFAGGI